MVNFLNPKNLTSTMKAKKRVMLVILDGWGASKKVYGNAVIAAKPKNFLDYKKNYPYTELCASGECVGLLKGIMGNSEVGHMHLGAGRLMKEELVDVLDSIKDKSFFKNKALVNAIERASKKGKALHIMGLASDGCVHSHIRFLFAMLELCKKRNFKNVYVHMFTDGRDTPTTSGIKYLKQTEAEMKKLGVGKIATVIGRYYAMDRDRRWQRTERAYNALLAINTPRSKSAEEVITNSYKQKITDEFILPKVIGDFNGVKDGDSIVFFNIRSDRARQISMAFELKKFDHFKRKQVNVDLVGMCEYSHDLKMPVAFPPIHPKNVIADVISKAGLKQFHTAETEKYAHVTYFFNGGIEPPKKGEDRLLIHSPKVATYDLKPEMSAYEVTSNLLKRINSEKYDFIVINYANPDMVGHTGVFKAVVSALKHVDKLLGQIVEAARKKGYICIITADHGNAEKMLYDSGEVCTTHTTNPVHFIVVDDKKYKLRNKCALYDVAPTILKLMGIKQPKEMKGKSIIV